MVFVAPNSDYTEQPSMNTALNIRDVGPELKTALKARAAAEGRPMADLARDLLAEALGVVPDTPEAAWRRENAPGLAALDRRSIANLDALHALSAVPMPDFEDAP